MKLVKFKDGTYGVRYGFLGFYTYQDFFSNYRWGCNTEWFLSDCRTTEKMRVSSLNNGETVVRW